MQPLISLSFSYHNLNRWLKFNHLKHREHIRCRWISQSDGPNEAWLIWENKLSLKFAVSLCRFLTYNPGYGVWVTPGVVTVRWRGDVNSVVEKVCFFPLVSAQLSNEWSLQCTPKLLSWLLKNSCAYLKHNLTLLSLSNSFLCVRGQELEGNLHTVRWMSACKLSYLWMQPCR